MTINVKSVYLNIAGVLLTDPPPMLQNVPNDGHKIKKISTFDCHMMSQYYRVGIKMTVKNI